MKKHKRKIQTGIVIGVFSVIIIACLISIFSRMYTENKEKEAFRQLAEIVTEDTTDATIEETIKKPNILKVSDFDNEVQAEQTVYCTTYYEPHSISELISMNSECFGWISIAGTNINYPVLQSHLDDNLYLDHDIYKNYSFSGSIYSQICNKRDYSDRVTVLYGHNMANGSMFATLHRFYDTDFFNKNKYIYVYTPDRKLTYEIVSAFEYDDRHIMNSFDFSDDKVFSDYLDMIENPHSVSVNKRNMELTTDDKILVLSTCLNSGDGRYLVQGVLKKDEPTK